MGYENEKASLNQFSELYKYCKDNVADNIQDIWLKNQEYDKTELEEELPFLYEAKKETSVPLASFDGGIATVFPTEIIELKLIKVAGAAPPEYRDVFTGFQKEIFHIYSGIFAWPKGADYTMDQIVEQTINDSLKSEILLETLSFFKISSEEYSTSMSSHLKYKQGKSIEDCFRELLEWCLIINFTNSQLNNPKINYKNSLPFLIVKDGSLYPSSRTLGGLFSEKIGEFLNSGKCPIVGVVKASRFVSEESSYRKKINKFLRGMKKNTFFKIPKKLEKIMDSKEYFYERYFFSLFAGKSVFEIQIPKVLHQVEKGYEKKIMDVLNSQSTFSYGGSISTNSFAHKEASLSESESNVLSNKLKGEFIKNQKSKEDSND